LKVVILLALLEMAGWQVFLQINPDDMAKNQLFLNDDTTKAVTIRNDLVKYPFGLAQSILGMVTFGILYAVRNGAGI
jgi:hypothetical protein